jgi:hypothetical protein
MAMLFIVLVVAPGTVAQGAGIEPRAQPPRLDLGTLRVGTRVEADFLVYWNERAKGDVSTRIELPAFVKKLRSHSDVDDDFGDRTRVWVEIDTRKARASAGKVEVKRNGRLATLPIRCVVLPRDPVSPRVLVVETPFTGYSTSIPKEFDGWRRVVDTGKLEVHYLSEPQKGASVLPVRLLQRVDVVLVGSGGIVRLTESDRSLLHGFICGGGRVLLSASMFYGDSVKQANRVLEPFGLKMPAKEGRHGIAFEFEGEDIRKHALTRSVKAIKMIRPTPTLVSSQGQVLVRVPEDENLAIIAIARTESGGEVITVGAPIFWHWAGKAPGNVRLLRNLLTRRRATR